MDEEMGLFRFMAYLPESTIEYRVLAFGPHEAYRAGMRELEARLGETVTVRKVEVSRYTKENGGTFESEA